MSELRRSSLLIFYLFFTLAFLAYTGQSLATSQEVPKEKKGKVARIEMDVSVFDLGTVLFGEEVNAKFTFRNVGDEVLEIYLVEPKSKNLSVVLSDKTIDPGESGHIEVTMDTKELIGNVIGKVSVITSDSEHREVMLEVRARVQALLAFNPPFVWVGQIAMENSYKNKVQIIGKVVEDGAFSGLTVDKTNSAVDAEIIFHNIKGEKVAYLEFVILPELRAGTFKESLSVISHDPPAKAQLTLFGNKLGVIEVTPERYDFFPRDDVESDVRVVTLESGKEFHIIKIEDPHNLFNTSIDVIEEGKKYEIIAGLKKPAEASFVGLIKVYTDLEEFPLIDIPAVGGP
jgi:hypothetical protein